MRRLEFWWASEWLNEWVKGAKTRDTTALKIFRQNLTFTASTLVRTSNMTNVEANHSSTGMTSGSHLPSFNVTTLRPNWSLVSLTLFNTVAQTWSSLTDKFYLNLSNFLLLGWNRMFDILFVVHSQAVKLGQDGHRLLHIPLSGSEVDNEIIIVQQEVLGKPSKFQQTLNKSNNTN